MASTLDRLQADIDEILPGVIADRRHFHEHPELGFQEFETAKVVAERLRSLGVEDVRTGIATTGVTGLVRGQKGGDGKVVMVRADMDALPILEENEVDYASQNPGTMHACGHDAHTAMLLGVTRVLMDRREEFSGTVKVLFQPAEEGGGGAKVMIDEGALSDPDVDLVFGMHVDQSSPVGTVSLRPGASLAAADRFQVTIKGRGGHGAYPHQTVDPIVVGAHIVTALQTIVAREVDPIQPAVVTVGALIAGEAFNVIPDTAELRGTLRSFDPTVRQHLAEAVERLVRGVASAMRAEVDFRYVPGYPATINDPEMAALVRQVAVETLGEGRVEDAERHMGAEDFSYFLEEKPGAFFFVGTQNIERGLTWGHHHPRFDIDEEGMKTGIEVMTRTVLAALAR